eukprot:1118703-Prorocentrum_lima.AAC.1
MHLTTPAPISRTTATKSRPAQPSSSSAAGSRVKEKTERGIAQDVSATGEASSCKVRGSED